MRPVAILIFCAALGPVPAAATDARLGEPRTLNGYHPWTPVTSPELWQARARRVRQRILVAAGLWPMPEPTPLDPVVTGKIDREGYTVEKVHFTSFPGFHVTGNLYRPRGKEGPLPGILSPHGHWKNGRFHRADDATVKRQFEVGGEQTENGARYPLQARCAMLARLGCVVFHYDMVGYADSKQIGHTKGFGDVEAELRLQSTFGLQTYNTIRALDFLVGLPDVDGSRVGVTGASGGGTQTFILNAIDPRPAVAFPAVMVSTSMQGGCICENASHLRVGTSNIEFVALCAPRPLGMTGADDWTIDIETKGLPQLQALYRAHGVGDSVMAKCFANFKHNYNQVSRELMYSWINRHLELGHTGPIAEKPFVPIPPDELAVFDDAHPRPPGVDAAALRLYLTAHSEKQMRGLRPHTAWSLGRFRTVVGSALEVITGTELPGPGGVESRSLGISRPGDLERFKGTREELLVGRTGSGEEVPIVTLRPDDWNGMILVIVHPAGKQALLETAGETLIPHVLETRAMLILPDVFLTGGLVGADGKVAAAPINERYAGYTFGYNRTVLANRVHDILTVIAHARGLARHTSVRLAAPGEAGLWVGLARAMAGATIERTALNDTGFRFADIDSMDHPAMLPGALKYGDVPAFLSLCAPGRLTIVADDAGVDPLLRAAYRAAGAPSNLRVIARQDAEPRQLIDWLLE